MTDRQILDLITGSLGYKTTVGVTDQRKVTRTLAGQTTLPPASKLGRAAWELARRVAPAPPPPPPPPPRTVAPRTYNGGLNVNGEPSARFCTFGLPRNANGRLYDDYATYDDDGRDLGGRTNLQVAGLKSADSMDGRSPCEPYGPFPPWPTQSYDR